MISKRNPKTEIRKAILKTTLITVFTISILLFALFQLHLEWVISKERTVSFILTVMAIIYLLNYIQFKYSYWKSRNVQFPPPTFFLGHTLKRLGISMPFMEFYDDVYYNHNGKDLCGLYEFLTPGLMVGNLTLIRDIFINDFECFSNRFNFDLTEINSFVTDMLPFCVGERWKNVRSSLTPTFTLHKLRQLSPFICEQSNKLVKILKKSATSQQEIMAQDFCGKYTMECIASCAFGIECEAINSDSAEFAKNGSKIFNFSPMRALKVTILIAAPTLARFIETLGVDFTSPEFRFFQNVATKTLKVRKEKGIWRGDFLDLLKDTSNLSEESIIAQSILFLLAGYDNTSSIMAFIMHLLALNPNIQEKLREEVKPFMMEGSGKDIYKCINECSYLEAVLKETLRLYPGSIDLQRVCTKDYIIPGTNLRIYKGQNITVPVWNIHRDPYYWPQPDVFDPERFLKEYNNHAFLPFGVGPRTCIGRMFATLTIKIGICKMITSFRIEPSINTVNPPPIQSTCFSLKSKNRLPLMLKNL